MSPGEISILDHCVLRGLLDNRFHPVLRDIIIDLAENFGLIMTTSYRPRRYVYDLHATDPVMAIDIQAWHYDYPEAIINGINSTWIFDEEQPARKCANLYYDEASLYIHIQVNDKTIRVDKT